MRLLNLHKKCFNDLTGKKFGKLTVLNIDHREGKVYFWKCKCDCGNYTVVRSAVLNNGHTKSCGCAHKKALLKDLIGMKFGKLTVMSYSHQEGKNHFWNCECDCGSKIIANGKTMRAGNKTSCGCAKRKINLKARKYDLSNKKFGKLTAIEPRNKSLWFCKCECGNTTEVKTADLVRGFTQSCGCISTNFDGSKNENEIRQFVQNLLPNETITKEKILDNGSRKLEIDIFIPSKKIGIEYNGSAFHASENTKLGDNKSEYYHQKKFLQARSQGIHLITIFDIDYETNKEKVINTISNIINKNMEYAFIPTDDIVYTDNDYDDGEWIKSYGYKECSQIKPDYFIYGKEKYKVYRCGKTKWIKDNTEVTS